jgi:hypothetical protein
MWIKLMERKKTCDSRNRLREDVTWLGNFENFFFPQKFKKERINKESKPVRNFFGKLLVGKKKNKKESSRRLR